jgi:hypothetical protein
MDRRGQKKQVDWKKLKFEAKSWDLLSCDTDKDECREKKRKQRKVC